jgi:hypothetical protein
MPARLRSLLTGLAFLGATCTLPGCTDTASPSLRCGQGTRQYAGQCVAEFPPGTGGTGGSRSLACGPGTHEQAGLCVVDGATPGAGGGSPGAGGSGGSGGSGGTAGAAGSSPQAGGAGAPPYGQAGGNGFGGLPGAGGGVGDGGAAGGVQSGCVLPPPLAPSAGSCVSLGQPGYACNPVTAEGCDTAGGEACDFNGSAFQCYGPPNELAACDSCPQGSGNDAIYCKAGLTCFGGGGACRRYCCDDGDCGPGSSCVAQPPTMLGVCDAGSTDAFAGFGPPAGQGGAAGGPGCSGGTCAHAACEKGNKLGADCSPCVAAVCKGDDYCCSTEWDDQCVGEADSACSCACGAAGGGASAGNSGQGGAPSGGSGGRADAGSAGRPGGGSAGNSASGGSAGNSAAGAG